MTDINNFVPKKIGNFNIPKTVIETKVDTLAFLELLLRKNIASWDEIEEIRAAVVLHMNVMYPELQLSYSTPAPLKDQGPIASQEEPAKPIFYNAPPPEILTQSTPPTQPAPQPTAEQKPVATAGSPLYAVNQPKITSAIKPQSSEDVPQQKPLMPQSGPPKILSNPPRKKM